MELPAAARHLLEVIGALVSETDVDAMARLLLERMLISTSSMSGSIAPRYRRPSGGSAAPWFA